MVLDTRYFRITASLTRSHFQTFNLKVLIQETIQFACALYYTCLKDWSLISDFPAKMPNFWFRRSSWPTNIKRCLGLPLMDLHFFRNHANKRTDALIPPDKEVEKNHDNRNEIIMMFTLFIAEGNSNVQNESTMKFLSSLADLLVDVSRTYMFSTKTHISTCLIII